MLLDARQLGSLKIALYVWLILAAIFLLAPVVFLALLSLDSSQWLIFPPPHWTTKWYAQFFSTPSWTDAIKVSLKVAGAVSILATILGVPASFGLVRGKFPGRSVLNAYFMLPMIVPVIVVGISIYAVFLKLGLTGTFLGFVLAHTVLALPFTIICTTTALRGFEPDIERAAIICGANPIRAKIFITVRNIIIGVSSGALFAFLISWDEIVVALFMATPSLQTLPIKMWTTLRLELNPLVAVAGSLLALVTLVCLVIGGGLLLWSQSRKKQAGALNGLR